MEDSGVLHNSRNMGRAILSTGNPRSPCPSLLALLWRATSDGTVIELVTHTSLVG